MATTRQLTLFVALSTSLAAQVDWQQKLVLPGPGFRYAATTHDSIRGVTVIFGGVMANALQADTWEWNGSGWTERITANQPPAVAQSRMVFDSARGVCVLQANSEIWEYDGVNWSDRTPAGFTYHPDSSWVYDASRARVVSFGGEPNPGTATDEIWEWDGTSMAQVVTANSPSPRSPGVIGYDPIGQRIVMYGGYPGWPGGPGQPPPYTDTWAYDGTNWTQLAPANAPHGGTAVTHLGLGRLLVVTPNQADIDQWDGSNWTTYTTLPAVTPTYSGVVYDQGTNQLVATTGDEALGGPGPNLLVQACDLTQWTHLLSGPVRPQSRYEHGMVFDHTRGHTLVHGGYNLTDTWSWDGSTWTQLASSGPTPRYSLEMADHSSRGEIVLYGGYAPLPPWGFPGPTNDTWIWNGTTWTRVFPATQPVALRSQVMGYHAALDRTIMFGGISPSGTSNLTYEWNGANWTLLAPATTPPPRYGACMAYDVHRERLVMFGGFSSMSDTWEWDGTDWSNRTPVVSPPGHWGYQISYDSARRRTVLFGDNGTTWEWNGQVWTMRTPATTSPPGRSDGGMAYDPVRQQTVLLGGISTGLKPGTWVYAPTYAATTQTFGSGCAGTQGIPLLSLEQGELPWLGESLTLVVAPVPAPEVGLVWLGSNTSWLGSPLPASLHTVGMPGCQLLVGLDVAMLVAGTANQLAFTFAMPTTPTLLGSQAHWQAAALDAPANALGLVTTQALTMEIGGL